MKAALFALTLIFSFSASAIPTYGSPVEFECGTQKAQMPGQFRPAVVAVEKACRARLVGLQKEAIVIYKNDGTSELWTVEDTEVLNVPQVVGAPAAYKLSLVLTGKRSRNNQSFQFPNVRGLTAEVTLLVNKRTQRTERLVGQVPGNPKFNIVNFKSPYEMRNNY